MIKTNGSKTCLDALYWIRVVINCVLVRHRPLACEVVYSEGD